MNNRETTIPAVCKNEECEYFKSFELYDIDEVKDPQGNSYIECYKCKKRIEII